MVLLHIWGKWGGIGCGIRDCGGWKVDLTMFGEWWMIV